MKHTIFLKDVHFHAFHGVGAQETLIGNEFIINLELSTDFTKATQSDEVDDTISYAEVYEVVKSEMIIPSKLLEHVAGRIVKALFEQFDNVLAINIVLEKRNPPMGACIESAGVSIYQERE